MTDPPLAANADALWTCTGCQQELAIEAFSKRQRKRLLERHEQARCTKCAAAAAAASENTTTNGDSNAASDEVEEGKPEALYCHGCKQERSIEHFSKRQKRLKQSTGRRCKDCIDTERKSETKVPRKKKQKDEPQTPQHVHFVDGVEVASPPTVPSGPKITRTKKRRRRTLYDDEDDSAEGEGEDHDSGNKGEGGEVSLEALKYQVLGRTLRSSTSSAKQESSQILTDKSTIDDLRRELSCAVCHEVLYQPVSLHCGHSFCGPCLQWWRETKSTSNCPTCRSPLVESIVLSVNTAVRACLQTLFSADYTRRKQAEEEKQHRALAGEDGGAHDRGYEILRPLPEQAWDTLNKFGVRRSVVLDTDDQRMQFSLAFHGTMPVLTKKLYVQICLLHMEEDEVGDSGFPLLVTDQDDEEHFVVMDRFANSPIIATAYTGEEDGIQGDRAPVALRYFGADGTVVFEVHMDDIGEGLPLSRTTHVCIQHEETGAELELRLPVREASAPSTTTDERQRPIVDRKSNPRRFVPDAMDEEEEDDGDENMDQFEDDGFVVGEDDDERSVGSDECCQCHDVGNLIVCDGGEAVDGCGRNFHLECVERTVIPEGDWICQTCANEFGLNKVGIRGHEFASQNDDSLPVEEAAAGGLNASSDEDVGEGSFSPAGEDAAFSEEETKANDAPSSMARATATSMARATATSIDSEGEDDDIPVNAKKKATAKRRRAVFDESDDEEED